MAYYNYHAEIKKLILSGRLIGYQFVDDYNGIRPALVLYFSDHRPMPIRSYRWEEYLPLLVMQSDKIKEIKNVNRKDKK